MNRPPLDLTSCTMDQALDALGHLAAGHDPQYVCFCDSNTFVGAAHDSDLAEALRGARMVFADGIAVLTACRLEGRRVPERVPGPSLFLRACDEGRERGWRHFFYGGQSGVPERLAVNLRERFPGIHIVGAYSPPFRELTDAEKRDIKAMIESAEPHFLWVALGGAKQVFWMREQQRQGLRVPVMLGVGAAFDFHCGNQRWAPPLVRRCGMEWAWRTATGGSRVFRRNAQCVTSMALQLGGICLKRVLRKPPRLTISAPPGLEQGLES